MIDDLIGALMIDDWIIVIGSLSVSARLTHRPAAGPAEAGHHD
jgi:hypothetical protein